MASAVGVRGDYEAVQLRELAKRSEDANQTRRLLALAAIYDGGSRTEAAKIGGVGLQTVRDWVLLGIGAHAGREQLAHVAPAVGCARTLKRSGSVRAAPRVG
jgi:hypothetical protein